MEGHCQHYDYHLHIYDKSGSIILIYELNHKMWKLNFVCSSRNSLDLVIIIHVLESFLRPRPQPLHSTSLCIIIPFISYSSYTDIMFTSCTFSRVNSMTLIFFIAPKKCVVLNKELLSYFNSRLSRLFLNAILRLQYISDV